KTLARAMIQYAAKLTADSGLRDVLRDVVETPLDAERMPDGGGGALGPFELHDFFLYYTMRWGFPPDKLLRMAAHAFGGKYPAAELESVLSVFLSRFGHSPGPMCGTARVDSVWASGSRLMAGCLPPEDGA
ncbi:MAG: hypothetical protein FWH06_02880, partial [Oscillospiraceae bacterium]|nr:hypothetical protein [Oscillospiraceae bacterium]